jgi:hypothetical protein
VVQDLVVRAHVTNFRCERWQTPDGKVVTASLPAGIDGHFGPQLRRFVLAVTLLRSLGIFISKRQVVRLLNAGKDEFLTEARDVLRAGLSSADWITVDGTGGRTHKTLCPLCPLCPLLVLCHSARRQVFFRNRSSDGFYAFDSNLRGRPCSSKRRKGSQRSTWREAEKGPPQCFDQAIGRAV